MSGDYSTGRAGPLIAADGRVTAVAGCLRLKQGTQSQMRIGSGAISLYSNGSGGLREMVMIRVPGG